MKKFREIAEQHREKGRFKPTIPRMVPSVPVVSPRPTSDSADVRLKEASAAAIAAATAISKKKSGNYDKEGMRVKPYKNPDHPSRKSNEQRRKEMNEYVQQQDPAELRGTSSAAMSLLDKPNKEPMKTYKQLKNITELSTELLHRYKEKAAADASKADKAGNFERGNKRFSGVIKATNKQFANFKKKGFSEAKDDKREYDYEGEMVKSDLRSIIANANRLIDMLDDDDNLPEWCQNKVTLAEDYISTVANYMTAEMNEEVEQLDEKNKPTNPELWARAKALARSKFDVYPSAYANGWASKWYKSKGGGWRSVSEEIELQEGRPSQRHPLEGHEYHKKSDAELVHIAKDAHKAAEAMKGHNTQAENKYRDQANDSATVRYFRQKSGMPDWYKKKYGHVKEEKEQIDEISAKTAMSYLHKTYDTKGYKDHSPQTQKGIQRATRKVSQDAMQKDYEKSYKAGLSTEETKPPFEGGTKPKDKVIAGKHGKGYSTARHLARMAMQKQVEKAKKPIKEESKKAKIVKDVMKKKTSEDAFQKDPELSNTLSKNV